jgi:methionine-rich copper-binding protein CopC
MPVGNYAADAGYFAQAFTLDPMTALADGDQGPNGMYHYGSSGFPDQSFGATNYWVDVVFTIHDANPPRVVDSTPAPDVNSVSVSEPLTLTFGSGVKASSIDLELRSAAGETVSGSTNYDSDSQTLTFTPDSNLGRLTKYALTLKSAENTDGVPLTEPVVINFTTIGVVGSYPSSIWDSADKPTFFANDDTSAVELGVHFTSDVDGSISALRYYKAPGSPGAHVGHLWSPAGELLATVAFGTETLSGWQQASLSTPVDITADTVYTVSYYCPNGVYGVTAGDFLDGGTDRGVLHALPNSNGGNGVYQYGASSFPTSTSGGANYFADIVFTAAADDTPPAVSSVSPANKLIAVNPAVKPTAAFNEPIDPGSLSFSLRLEGGDTVDGAVCYDDETQVATFDPSANLAKGTKYVATVTASDVAGNPLTDPVSWSFTTVQPDGATPVTLWDTSAVPDTAAVDDDGPVEVGVWMTAASDGLITGVRFYKGLPNTGYHQGHIWSESGTLLATATFSDESASGWQQAMFADPVAVTADTPFVVSYHAPKGGYSHTGGGLSSRVSNGQLSAPASTSDRPNGVFRYGSAAFPTSGYNAGNYWIDAIFVDNVGATVTDTTPANGATGIDRSPRISATFSEAVDPSSIVMKLRDAGGGSVSGQVTYDSSSNRATFTPDAQLDVGAVYTAAVEQATDDSGNALKSAASWSFTVVGIDAQSLWSTTDTPANLLDSSADPVELGVKFRTSTAGQINGIRFYKGGPTAQGPHGVSLWSESGARLATAPAASESARGWQTVMFADPIPIVADTVYVASYFAPNGHCSYDSGYFASSARTNGDLTAPKDGADGPNGVFAESSSSTFPSRNANGTNYWVDVLFTRS